MKRLCSLLLVVGVVWCDDFARLDEALPSNIDITSIAPVFDFDSDGCLPAAGISRNGDQNGGLSATGSVTGGCRFSNFLDLSNTVHRHACASSGGNTYCGHFYALYFVKDQLTSLGGGHRHDWEYAAIWTTNGAVTHGSYSAHGDLTTESASNIAFTNGHLKIVYHKEGVGSHAFRFSNSTEQAENPYGAFVTPTIISWYEMRGDNGWNSAVLRTLLTRYDYGGANLPMRDGSFISNLNEFSPDGYPTFASGDVGASNTGPALNFNSFVNRGTGLCLDLLEANAANGVNVLQYECHGGDNQRWTFDTEYNVIRSLIDPRYCLDHTADYANGSNVFVWWCHHGHEQTWTPNSDGSYRVAASQGFALDGEVATGNVVIWGSWGGENQKWNLS